MMQQLTKQLTKGRAARHGERLLRFGRKKRL